MWKVVSTFVLVCFYRSANYATLVTAQLILVASHMVVLPASLTFLLCQLLPLPNLTHFHLVFVFKAGLGLPDTDSWYMIETIAEKNNIGHKQFVSYLYYVFNNVTLDSRSILVCCNLFHF